MTDAWEVFAALAGVTALSIGVALIGVGINVIFDLAERLWGLWKGEDDGAE